MSESDFQAESALIATLPQLPRVAGKPVFYEEWQARVFAITIQLFRTGHFKWEEWVNALSEELKSAANRGERADGSLYYTHWLTALERLTIAKGMVRFTELLARKEVLGNAQQS